MRRYEPRYAPVILVGIKTAKQAPSSTTMSSAPSCLASITSALTTAPAASPGGEGESSLREGLLRRPSAPSSRREAIEQLRERAEALRREVEAAKEGAEAAEEAARRAEVREREAAAEIQATARASKTEGEKLRVLEDELRFKDGRIKVLEAIMVTIAAKKKWSVRP